MRVRVIHVHICARAAVAAAVAGLCRLSWDLIITNFRTGGMLFGTRPQKNPQNRYSTLKDGECAPDQAVGTGACFWKFHGVQRRVNATCVKKRIAAKIEARNAKCFVSSILCFVFCVFVFCCFLGLAPHARPP